MPPRTRRSRTGAAIATTTSGSWLGGWVVLVQALVWTVVVEVPLVRAEHGTNPVLVVDQHPVGAFGSDAADEPFGSSSRETCGVGS
jgi:hypothetical protein